MVTLNWSCKVILAFITAASSTELVPERFLRPRDFNHHPFTDVGVPASLKQTPRIPQTHPYAILAKKRPREGRQFPHQDVILYPSPHPSVLPKKHLETNEISNDIITNEVSNDVSHYDDPYVHIPKNYAFSYSVKDHQSGDDFSHSQAHNGKATRGQYRVKLPDGRVQVVSYTADHKGYRADVQYEEDPSAKRVHKPSFYEQNIPETPTALPHHIPNTVHKFQNHQNYPRVTEEPDQPEQQPEPVQYRFVPRYNIEPSNYLTNPSTPEPQQYSTPRPIFIIRTTPSPQYDDYSDDRYVQSTTPTPYHYSSTPQFGDRHRYVSSTPAPTPYTQRQYTSGNDDYNDLASSNDPRQIIVTPRTLFSSAVHDNNDNNNNNELQQRSQYQRPHILYRVVQPAGR